MRISDWSSDVCSSDLSRHHKLAAGPKVQSLLLAATWFLELLDAPMLTPGAPIKPVECLPVWAGSVSSNALMGHPTGSAIILAVKTRHRPSIPTPSTHNSSPPNGNSAIRPLMQPSDRAGLSTNVPHTEHPTQHSRGPSPP